MNFLPKLSMRNRAFIALVSVVIVILGYISMTQLRRELIPPVQLPGVAITAVNQGASSEQMSDLVAGPLEREMRVLDNLDNTSAMSVSNFSLVTVELEYGSDVYRAASQADVIVNRLSDQLPEGTTTTVITGGTSDIPAMVVSAGSDLSAAEMIDLLEISTIPDLESIEGVATVQVFGAGQQLVRINPDDEALAEQGASRADIVDALEDAGVVLPGGSVTDGTEELDISIGNPFEEISDLEDMLISGSETGEGQPSLRLGDVATVELEDVQASTLSRTNGQNAVTLLVMPTAEANFIEVSEEATALFTEAEEQLGNNTTFTPVFDQAVFIDEAIAGLATEGMWGLVLAIVVIFVFLFAVRPTIITGVSIPLSIMFAFAGMLVTGTTINMMSLAGLMITIGRLVDDSIVVIENIVRHLRHDMPKTPAERARTIVQATSEVASAVVSSTLVAMLVFVPVLFVSGLAGELFRPFALTVVIALLGSVLVALTIVPVLAYWFMRSPKEKAGKHEELPEEPQDEQPSNFLAKIFRPVLKWALDHRWATVAASLVVFIGSLALVPLLPINLLGDDGMNMHNATQTVEEGTSLEYTSELAEGPEQALAELDVVDVVQVDIGGQLATGSQASNLINYTLVTDPEADQVEAEAQIRKTLEDYAEENPEAGEFEMAEAGGMLGSSTVDIRVEALNDETRADAAAILEEEVATLDSVERVTSNMEATQPSLRIQLKEDAVAEAGLTIQEATGMIAAYTTDYPVGSITIDGRDLDVHLEPGEDVETVEDIENLVLAGIPLEDIADVERVSIPPTINTVDAVRTITVSATPADSNNVGATTEEINALLEDIDLPEGTSAEIGGVADDIIVTFTQLALAMIAAVLVIYVVLVWLFKSLIQPLILLMAIPFGATGMILALLITNTPLGAPSLVGFLMLIGIVVTNSIVLIDLVNQYRRKGLSVRDSLMLGGQNRIRPIIMTAAATIGAMIPPAIGLSSSSSFVSAPMAISVIGGLIVSTLVTLLIVPVLYSMTQSLTEKFGVDADQHTDHELDEQPVK